MSDSTSPTSVIAHFLGLIRFSHTVFALPFAALASVWALALPVISLDGYGSGLRLTGILLAMIFARSAAMAFNRLVDARFDQLNPRTAGRHIPAGLISRSSAWVFFVACCGLFVASTLLFLPNQLPLWLSLPVLGWLCAYSYAKRYTSAAHLWLGVALALSPICAWIGLRGELFSDDPADGIPAILLAAAIASWVAGFDIIYACQDAEFDRRTGLHSIPARFGIKGALRIAAWLHLLMWLFLVALPLAEPRLGLGFLYFLGLFCVAGLLLRQHWIVNPQDLSRVNEAFFNINAIISFGFCSLAAIDALI
jgi:4-hydroxybenzoate polyprenyltransferase